MPVLIFFLLISLTGCSFDSLFFWEDDEPVAAGDSPDEKEAAAVGKAAAPSQQEEASEAKAGGSYDYNLSKLIARVSELEAQVRRQREDFHVLRKGLMTGLIPSDWQDDLPKYSHSYGTGEGESGVDSQGKSAALSVILGEGEGGGGKGFSGMSEKDRRRYEQKLAKANHHFRSGDYGKAILTYTEIGRDYSDRVTKGSHLLWIGASWFRLKDYQAARKHLVTLVERYKTSPWVPEAEFLLSKTDFREGFIERSLESLKEIIRKYPQENIADRAKEELKRVEERL